jgi:serralysin
MAESRRLGWRYAPRFGPERRRASLWIDVIHLGANDEVIHECRSFGVSAQLEKSWEAALRRVQACQSASSLVASGGSGALVVGATNASVTGGAGGTTLFGAAGGMLTYGNTGGAGSLEYGAEAGSETLNASASNTNNLIYAGGNAANQDLLVAGSGNDVLVAGQGSSTLTGGAGNNMFDFFCGADGGHASITDFTSQDVVNLSGYGAGAALAAQQSAVVAGGNPTITLIDNTQITFLGVSSAVALSGHIMSS